jgi:hypothetical protein
MSSLVIPNTFVTGTTIQAAPFNGNFSAIQTWSSNIDNTNIGVLGIYPSQLIPTTAAQALVAGTFGIAAANATGQVNLGVMGASGASIYLAAGGTAFTPASSTQPFKFTNAVNTVNNFEILDAGGVLATTGGSTTASYLPPCYTAAGAAVAGTLHIVQGTFVGTGGSANLTLSGAAAFTSATSYIGFAVNTSVPAFGGMYAEPASGTNVAFAGTTNGNNYLCFLIGT